MMDGHSTEDEGTGSLSDSIKGHIMEGDLRYHAYHDGAYVFPNDETQQNCEDMRHSITVMLCNKELFYAPVDEQLKKSGARVLDLGTGTGIWACEVGHRYPLAKVTGIDISPIQPTLVPPNVTFAVDDFEDEWVEDEDWYDYIYVRHTMLAVRNTRNLLDQIYRHLKPGGYVEFQGFNHTPRCDDGSLTPETPYALREFFEFLEEGMARFGLDLNSIELVPEALGKLGFTDINTQSHKAPFGAWPHDKTLQACGAFAQTSFVDGLRGLAARPFGPKGLGWSNEQLEAFLAGVRKDCLDPSFHVWFPLHVVYARKPL